MAPFNDAELSLYMAAFDRCVERLQNEGRWKEALAELLPLVDPKNEMSQYGNILAHKIGAIHLLRQDGKQDLAEAEKWLRKGQPAKDGLLACVIYRSDSARISEAVAAAREAAEAGQYAAMLQYSKYVRFGLGISADEAAADNWIRKAHQARLSEPLTHRTYNRPTALEEFPNILKEDFCAPADGQAADRLPQILE